MIKKGITALIPIFVVGVFLIYSKGTLTASSIEPGPVRSRTSLQSGPSTTSQVLPGITRLTGPQKTFAETASSVLQKLPTLADMKTITSEEAHRTPKVILQAGLELSKIAEALEENPALRPEGIAFYKKCCHTESYPSSIRAMCYMHLKKLDPNQFSNHQEDSEVPEHVQRIANSL